MLNSEGKKFHIMGLQKCPNVFVRSLWIHKILLSEEECKFLLGV